MRISTHSGIQKHIWWLFFVVVLQHRGNKPVCTGRLLWCASLKFQLRNCRWVVSTHWEHPVTYLKPTSSREKHQYLQEYTEASKILKPLHLLHVFSVLVPVSSHSASSPTFFFNKYFFSESSPQDILKAKKKTSYIPPAGLQSKVYIPGQLRGMLPSGALDQIWGLQVWYLRGRLGCSVTGTFKSCQYHRVMYTDFYVMLIWSADESVKVVKLTYLATSIMLMIMYFTAFKLVHYISLPDWWVYLLPRYNTVDLLWQRWKGQERREDGKGEERRVLKIGLCYKHHFS